MNQQLQVGPWWKNGVYYPEEMVPKVGVSVVHCWAINHLLFLLQQCVSAADLLTSDLLIYYEEGNLDARVSPDVLIAFGEARTPKPRSLFLWEETRMPEVIFEVASLNTHREDITTKLHLYEELGVREYFLYDPEAEFWSPPLQGFRRYGRQFRQMRQIQGRLWSKQLQLFVEWAPERLQLYRADGSRVLTDAERAEALERELALLRQQLAQRPATP